MAPLDKPLNPPRKKKMGFAVMAPERRLELARKGGANVPHEKRAFAANKALAIEAGRKGGAVSKGGGRPPGAMPENQAARMRRLKEYNDLHRSPLHPANRKP